MICKTLLGSTAIFAAVLAAPTPVDAGTVGTGDNLAVSIFGEYRFHISFRDQDKSTGFGRGYNFRSGESELGVEARNTADNGILYGVRFILNTNTDDVVNADKTFAFIDDKNNNLGRLELGDQDDAIDRMFVAGEDALVGRAGYDGEVADEFDFGDTWIGVQYNNTGQATKAIYFSPRIAPFQVGPTITPDSGSRGASFTERDDNGDFENVLGLAANYVGEVGDFTVILSIAGETGDGEADTSTSGNSTGGTSAGTSETFGIGGTISYSEFTFGLGYVDLGEAGVSNSDRALGADGGKWWSVGLGYRSGPWGVSIGYYEAAIGNVSGVGDTKNEVISIDAEYEIAPGWQLAGSLNFADAENRDRIQGNDNNGHVAIFYNIFTF